MSEDIKLEEVNPAESPTDNTSSGAPDDWSQLHGRTQDRVKKLIEQKNLALDKARANEQRLSELQRQLEDFKAQQNKVPMPPGYTPPTNDELAAVNRLKQFKFATVDDVQNAIKDLQRREESLSLRRQVDERHQKLSKLAEQKGYPTYDESEIESKMEETGIYDPEYHYRKLYQDEISAREIELLKSKSTKSSNKVLQTRSRIGTGQPLTPETLNERLAQPDGTEYYIKNKETIDKVTAEWMKDGLIK